MYSITGNLLFDCQLHIPGFRLNKLPGEAFGQFPVFGALGMTAAAKPDDHIDIIRRDIFVSHIAVIVVYAIKWTDV